MSYTTRIAPSPTGDMHVGTARTAALSWLAARASGGKFILRIDDTDVDRNQEATVDVIFKTLEFLGLGYDELYYQSKRGEIYAGVLADLERSGFTKKLDNGAIALDMSKGCPTVWRDEIAGEIEITDTNVSQMDGRAGTPILARGGDKQGQVTYQFASVVDDYLMGVDYIIRGTDHITNTAKQVAIWVAMSLTAAQGHTETFKVRELPKFAHVGLIFKGGKKMSKRDGAASMLHYQRDGFDPDGMMNFLCRMGWSVFRDDKSNSIIPREKLIRMFLTEGKMRNTNANFDEAKLMWYDRKFKAMKTRAAA